MAHPVLPCLPVCRFPGSTTQYATGPSKWTGMNNRPGTELEDSLAGSSILGRTHFDTFHKYGMLWEPGQFIRWCVGLWAVGCSSVHDM